MSTIRILTITVADNKEYVDYIYTYDPEETKDSEALKNLLCEVDPGKEYTISFKNVQQVVKCGCEHTDHFNDSFGEQTKHNYQAVDAGMNCALWVGYVCDDCANTCMSGSLM